VRIAIERGAVIAERNVLNAKADPVLISAAKRLGYIGPDADAQAILDFCLLRVVEFLVSSAKSQELQVTADASTTNLDP